MGVFRKILVGALIAALPVRTVHAQANYRSSPIGGRSTLMGGTGLAYGSDGAAPFMNPATLVLVEDERLAFSVNFYTFTAVSARKWWVPGPIDRTRFGNLAVKDTALTDLEFNALPSSLCLFIPMPGKSRLGVCLATTQAQAFSFAAERFDTSADIRVTQQAQTLLQSFSRFAAGPTYAVQLSDSLTFGASLHGSLSAHRSAMNAVAVTHGGATSPISSSLYNGSRGDSFQLHALAGITYRVRGYALALALEAPSIHIYGIGAANRHTQFEGAGASNQTVTVDGSYTSATPFRVGIGAGVVGSRGIAELNFHIYAPMARAYSADLTGRSVTIEGGVAREERVSVSLAQRARAVLNAGLGGEYFLSPSVSVLGGLSTDFSSLPSGELRGDLFNYYQARNHRLAFSFGIGSHGQGGEMLVGTELSYAWGQKLAMNSYQLPPTFGISEHSTFVALLIVAGSTNLSSIRKAVLDARDALKR